MLCSDMRRISLVLYLLSRLTKGINVGKNFEEEMSGKFWKDCFAETTVCGNNRTERFFMSKLG